MYYTRFETPLCEMIIAGDEEGLNHLHLNTGDGKRRFLIAADWQRKDEFFSDAIRQIREYIAGERTEFKLKLNPRGTEFQRQVWRQLGCIPYGETRSYGEIAAAVGRPGASRAVGAANGRNPISLIVPCHRVIGASGKLTGYAHGLDIKQRLLEIESKNKRA